MRIVIDTLVALMLAGILAGVTLHTRERREDESAAQALQANVSALNREVQLRSALGQVELSEGGFPRTIDPEWFKEALPHNPLLDDGRPWMEIAPIEQRGALHPPDITPTTRLTAGFWYNPYTGVVRARVPAGQSDRSTLQLYNFVNSTDLVSRFPAAHSAGN